MYDMEDVSTLTQRFMDTIDGRKNKKENHFNVSIGFNSTKNINRKLSREEELKKRKLEKAESRLLYSEFLKIILDFQLQEHEKFLSRFTLLFKQIDHDKNGIIDEVSFLLVTTLELIQTTGYKHGSGARDGGCRVPALNC